MDEASARCFSPVIELPGRRLHGFAVARTADGVGCLPAALACARAWADDDGPTLLLDACPADDAECARLAEALLAAPHPELLVVRVARYDRADPHALLERLVDHGVTVSLRELDIGAAELGLLAGAPIDMIELPAAAVAAVEHDRSAARVIEHRAQLAHHHDWLVIASDVQRPGQLAALERLGVDLVAGPAIGPPMTRDEALRLVARRRTADTAPAGAAAGRGALAPAR